MAGVFLPAPPTPVAAQSLDARAELATDDRRRGLSWSDGRPSAAMALTLRADSGIDLGVRAATTRGGARHLGADAVADATIGYARDIGGGLTADAFVTAHLFAGAAGKADYVEGGGGVAYSLGPAQIGLDARYAPSQGAIGGDALYLAARARAGIPATRWTIDAAVGRSSGEIDDPARAARLRPGGTYVDWALGATWIAGPWEIGARYTGTDIADDGTMATRHAGDRIMGRIAFAF